MNNQFMQVYRNVYNSTDKDDHEATWYKAIGCCLDRGATKRELLKLIATKTPLAVWEKDGVHNGICRVFKKIADFIKDITTGHRVQFHYV